MIDNYSTTSFQAQHKDRLVLVTGATGYVGGRLVPELLAAGFRVRATSRSVSSLERFPWFDEVEAVEADLSSASGVARAMEGVDTAFYLVHSMGNGSQDFEEAESIAARNVAQAADSHSVRQVVYLSGLHPKRLRTEELSKHMRSRENVAEILLAAETPAIVFQAATLIGSGSASFEMIRHLTELLPVMIAPNWIDNKIEPISIRDTLYYLCAAADLDEPHNQAFDIGCGTVYKFRDLLTLYGEVRGLKRFIRPLPWSLPMDKLSGMWIALVTPAPLGLAIPLAQSMAEDAVTHDDAVKSIIPDPPGGLADYPTSVRRALEREREQGVVTSWDTSWAEVSTSADSLPTDPEWAGHTVYTDDRTVTTDADKERLWAVIEGIGGASGWYSAPLLWAIRGAMDRAIGGPGLGGRRDPRHLKVNDRVDWWRVERIEPLKELVLRAEMKISGRAWLVFTLEDADDGIKFRQRAIYFPHGLLGRAYWAAVAPFHALIFPVMAKNIIKQAKKPASGDNAH